MASRPSVRTILWLIGIGFVLHEAEEWNLVSWLAANFEPAPGFSDRDARTLLVLFALLGIFFTAISLHFLSLRASLLALLPLFVAVVFGNALTHIVWFLSFGGGYAPGVVTAALLIVPLVIYLLIRVIRERLVSPLFVLPLLVAAILQPIGAALAGRSLSGWQVALQHFGSGLGRYCGVRPNSSFADRPPPSRNLVESDKKARQEAPPRSASNKVITGGGR